jgi:hypothetical protein
MRFLPVLSALFLLSTTPSAFAFGSRDVPIDFAQRGVDVKVTPEGVSIDLGSESIMTITISDRRQILVRKMGTSSVYLQRIQHQNIEGMLGMPDGSAVLRVWTLSGKRLSFRLTVGNSGGKDITIVPATTFASRPLRQPLPRRIAVAGRQDSAPVYRPIPKPVAASDKPYRLLTPASFERPISSPLETQKKKETVSVPLPESPDKKPKPDKTEIIAQSGDIRSVIPLASPYSEVNPTASEITPPAPAVAIPKIATAGKLKPYAPRLNQAQAIALLKGLNASKYKKGTQKIVFRSPLWNKTQSVIRLLRSGKSLDSAIKKTGSNPAVIQKLMEVGGV